MTTSTAIRIAGAIDRSEPDPTAPHSDMIRWIGSITAAWESGSRRITAAAAVLSVDTGGAPLLGGWGDHYPSLRWFGDRPSPEIAAAICRAIIQRGPAPGAIDTTVSADPPTPASPTFTSLRAPAALAR